MSLFASFCNMGSIYAPFSSSIFSAMVSEKVPVLVPFVTISIVQFILFGKVALIRFILFAIIFAFLTSIKNAKEGTNKDSLKTILLTVTFASAITETFLLLTGISPITEVKYILICVVMQIIFAIIFKRAIKYIDSIEKNSDAKITTVNSLSMISLLICVLSFLKFLTVFDISLWHAICVFLLMVYCWRNKVIKAFISSIAVVLVIGFTYEISAAMALLLVIVAVVTALLSHAGKKGAILGAVVCLLYVIAFGNGIDEDPIQTAIKDDYIKYLQTTIDGIQDKSGEEYQKYVTELERAQFEHDLKAESQKTNARAILKYMIIGFVLLAIIPAEAILKLKEHVDLKDEFKFIREKLFKNTKIYRLNAGK